MSQMIVCRSPKGIVMGAEAHDMDIDDQGRIQESPMHRLFQLNALSVLMVGGGAESASMGASLQSFMSHERFDAIEDVYAAALPFLATEYEDYMKRHCERLPIDPIHQIYFILAGHSPRNPSNPFQAHLIWTKRHLPLLDGDSILSAYAVPRLIRLEVQLNRMCQENHRLDDIFSVMRSQLQQKAQRENRPLEADYAVITSEGIQMRSE